MIDLGTAGVREVGTLQPFDNSDPEGPHPSSNGADGRARFLNERGEIAMALEFTDGSSGLLTRNITAVNCAGFGQAEIMVREGLPARLSVLRPGALNESLSLGVAVTGGSALAGIDFAPPPAVLHFAVNQFEALLPLEILDNGAITGDKTVELTLTDLSTGRSSVLTITIVDPGMAPDPPVLRGRFRIAGGFLRLPIGTKPGRVYVVDRSPDLRTWVRVLRIAGQEPNTEIEDRISGRTRQFYRVRELFEASEAP